MTALKRGKPQESCISVVDFVRSVGVGADADFPSSVVASAIDCRRFHSSGVAARAGLRPGKLMASWHTVVVWVAYVTTNHNLQHRTIATQRPVLNNQGPDYPVDTASSGSRCESMNSFRCTIVSSCFLFRW
jgi:hypothetical protein